MSHDGFVNSDGKIRGLDSIRICDASAFPFVPRANTHLTVIAAAEIFADKIIESHINTNGMPKMLSIARLNVCPQLSHEIASIILSEWPSENDSESDSNKLASHLLEQDTLGLKDIRNNENNYMLTWVATVENELAGTIRFCSHDMIGKDEQFGYCWIAALYVKEKYRHRSIGRMLVETVLKLKNDHSVGAFKRKQLHLWFPTSKKDHLLAFYKSCGFEVVSDGEFQFNKSSYGENVFVMRELEC